MKEDVTNLTGEIDRRGFLGKGAGAFAAAAALGDGPPGDKGPRVGRRKVRAGAAVAPANIDADGPGGQAAAQDPNPQKPAVVLPTRKLGRTGVDVTILNLGTWMSPGGDRLLRFAWANGVRYFDTAKTYGSEPMIGRWLQAMPDARKDLFLVTKDRPNTPAQLLWQLDQRLEALQTDYVDLIFIHALGDENFDSEVFWPHEPGVQGDRRGDPEVGQGEVRRLLDPSTATAGAPPVGRGRRVRRRDHAPEQSLDRPG